MHYGYHQFLNEGLPELVEEIPLAIRRKMSYLHEGARSNDGRHFFDILFYAFNRNYSIFTLLFKPLLFSD
jgi:hypothetical protein